MNNSLFKKVGASFVALTLAFSCTSAVSATGNNSEFTPSDYSLVIAPVVADLCTTPVALSAPPNSYQNNSQS